MYIHEYDNWWQFRYDANALIAPLAHVRAMQGQLLGKLSALGFSIQSKTALENLSLNILKSSEIEGEILPLDHVRSSLARRLGIEEAGLPEPSRYIEGIVDMMMDATQNYALPLTDERLFGWHNVLFPTGRSGLYKIDVAKYRTGDMQVVSGAMGMERVHYQAPSAERIPQEMQRFFDWFNSKNDIDAVLKSAIAHLWFVTIHPFDDGNGRIARAIADMLLARADGTPLRFYSMSNIICQRRKYYYEVLEHAQHGDGDITEWLLWFLDSLSSAIAATEATLTSVIKKAKFWETYESIDFNPRQRKILNMLLDGFDGNLNTGRWSRICKCSRDTALRDANDLIAKGVLKRNESGGRSTAYILV